MQTFIASCLADIQRKNKNISEHLFILPSKRACVFLKKEIAKQIHQYQFLPEIISIEKFIEKLSSLKTINNTEALFYFYEVYIKTKRENFDQFAKWAQTLLHDFNEIDRYNIDAEDFFNNLANIKQLEEWDVKENPTQLINNYLSFWNNGYQYYITLKEILLNKKIAYQGLAYREATEQLELYSQNTHKHHYFIGFNALNKCEEIIFKELQQQERATIYWDADNTFLNSYNSNTSLFFNQYQKEWNYYQKNPFSIKSDYFKNNKNIEVYPIAKNIGQLKKTGELLSTLSIKEQQETAVILSDENLLIPLLNSIPKNILNINITMGMALKDTPLSAFFEALFQLHIRQNNQQYYYKNIQQLLLNNYSQILFSNKDITTIVEHIHVYNLLYLDEEQLKKIAVSDEIKELFSDLNSNYYNIINHCKTLILSLKKKLDQSENNHLLDVEYLHRFYQLFNQIEQYQKSFAILNNLNAIYQIYKELLSTETLDFKGEPISGLQIMGMLESRALDFKRIILVSVNEGILPSGKSNNSFIPFDLKVTFNLPTYQHKDAVYAYHFFRLIQRAEDIKIIHNTEPDGLNTGEKSRFILQLESLIKENHQYHTYTSNPKIITNKKELKSIPKNNSTKIRIEEIGTKGFSPSSLTQYVRNPLDFYTQKVLGLYEIETIEEFVAANTLGTIVHNTLENFYKPFENNILTKEIIANMQQKVDIEISKQFKAQFKKGDVTKGKNFLIYHVAKRYVRNFLKLELETIDKYNEIIIRKIEFELKVPIPFNNQSNTVFMTGKVDRIDEVDGQLRIIDYKTGKVEARELTITNWETITKDYKKHSKAFQVLCYAYMMNIKTLIATPVKAGIISFKNIKAGFMPFKNHKDTLITQETLKQFEIQLKALIAEISDISIPFKEKEL